MQRPKIINCLTDTLNEIISLAKSLTINQLNIPTNCPGWDVRDNLSHIISIESWLLGNQITDHKASDISNTKNELGILNENEVDLRRSHSLADLINELQAVVIPRIEILKALTEEDLSLKAWTPIGEKTLEDQCMIRLLDCWAHLQDIKKALKMGFDESSESSALVLEYCMTTLPKTFAKSLMTKNDSNIELSLLSAVDLSFSTFPSSISEGKITFILAQIGGRGTFVKNQANISAIQNLQARATLTHENIVGLFLGRINYQDIAEQVNIAGNQQNIVRLLTSLNFMI